MIHFFGLINTPVKHEVWKGMYADFMMVFIAGENIKLMKSQKRTASVLINFDNKVIKSVTTTLRNSAWGLNYKPGTPRVSATCRTQGVLG